MASREQQQQATIDRLAYELAQERAANASLREELAATQRRVRTWRRVSEWIYRANRTPEEPPDG